MNGSLDLKYIYKQGLLLYIFDLVDIKMNHIKRADYMKTARVYNFKINNLYATYCFISPYLR